MLIKKLLKTFLKHNIYISEIFSKSLYLYLKYVYFTSRFEFAWPADYDKSKFLSEKSVIFAFWHNRLAIAPAIFKGHNDIYALISPHSDGKIISNVVSKFDFGVIEGSTNKGSTRALKTIIRKLSLGSNIVITPDGPRGPLYKINSNITNISEKYNIKIIPLSFNSSRNFTLKSWDKLIIPLPFSTIKIFVGEAIIFSKNQEYNDNYLEKKLAELAEKTT
jgi:lysophospholipid acyltransferase (LPLAT)-like uncharacterized protein